MFSGPVLEAGPAGGVSRVACDEPAPLPVGDLSRHGVLPGFSNEEMFFCLQKKMLSYCSLPFLQQLLSFYLHTLFTDLLILFGEKSIHSSP